MKESESEATKRRSRATGGGVRPVNSRVSKRSTWIFGAGGPWRIVRQAGILGIAVLVVGGGVGFLSDSLDLYDRIRHGQDLQALAERRQPSIDDGPGEPPEQRTSALTLTAGPRFKAHDGSDRSPAATSVAVRHDGKVVASGGQDRMVRMWDSETGEKLAELSGHLDDVTSVAFQPKSSLLASGSWDQTIRLWDVTTPSSPRHLATLKTKNAIDVTALAFSPDGQEIAAAGGWWVEIFNVQRRSHVRDLFIGANIAMEKVAYSPNGALIVTAGTYRGSHRAWLWDAKSGVKVADLGDHRSYVRGVAFTLDSKYAITASFDRFVRVWTTDGQLVREIDTGVGVDSVVASGRDGKLVLAEGSSVVVRDPVTFKERGTMGVCPNVEAVSVAVDADEHLIAVACYDGTVGIVKVPPT